MKDSTAYYSNFNFILEKFMMEMDLEDLDSFDWFILKLFGLFKGIYNPLERLATRKKYLTNFAEQITDVVFGQDSLNRKSKIAKDRADLQNLENHPAYQRNDTYQSIIYRGAIQKLRILHVKSAESYQMYKDALQRGKIVPKQVESAQIVDMLFKYDQRRNQTVLVALQNGGLISSFLVD